MYISLRSSAGRLRKLTGISPIAVQQMFDRMCEHFKKIIDEVGSSKVRVDSNHVLGAYKCLFMYINRTNMTHVLYYFSRPSPSYRNYA